MADNEGLASAAMLLCGWRQSPSTPREEINTSEPDVNRLHALSGLNWVHYFSSVMVKYLGLEWKLNACLLLHSCIVQLLLIYFSCRLNRLDWVLDLYLYFWIYCLHLKKCTYMQDLACCFLLPQKEKKKQNQRKGNRLKSGPSQFHTSWVWNEVQ